MVSAAGIDSWLTICQSPVMSCMLLSSGAAMVKDFACNRRESREKKVEMVRMTEGQQQK